MKIKVFCQQIQDNALVEWEQYVTERFLFGYDTSDKPIEFDKTTSFKPNQVDPMPGVIRIIDEMRKGNLERGEIRVVNFDIVEE